MPFKWCNELAVSLWVIEVDDEDWLVSGGYRDSHDVREREEHLREGRWW